MTRAPIVPAKNESPTGSGINPVSLTLLPSTLRALYHAAGSALAGKTPDDPEADELRIFVRYVEARWPEIEERRFLS